MFNKKKESANVRVKRKFDMLKTEEDNEDNYEEDNEDNYEEDNEDNYEEDNENGSDETSSLTFHIILIYILLFVSFLFICSMTKII